MAFDRLRMEAEKERKKREQQRQVETPVSTRTRLIHEAAKESGQAPADFVNSRFLRSNLSNVTNTPASIRERALELATEMGLHKQPDGIYPGSTDKRGSGGRSGAEVRNSFNDIEAAQPTDFAGGIMPHAERTVPEDYESVLSQLEIAQKEYEAANDALTRYETSSGLPVDYMTTQQYSALSQEYGRAATWVAELEKAKEYYEFEQKAKEEAGELSPYISMTDDELNARIAEVKQVMDETTNVGNFFHNTDVDAYISNSEKWRSAAAELEELEKEHYRRHKLNAYTTDINKDNFFGRFESNFDVGMLTEMVNEAYSNYLWNPTATNKAYADQLAAVLKQYQENNAAALDDNGWISKSAAGHLPQLGNQLKAGGTGAVAGGLAGAAIGSLFDGVGALPGAWWGAKRGYTVGTGVYSFNSMRGAAYRTLIELGADEMTARAAAMDEAVISAMIEMVDAEIDLKLLGKINISNPSVKKFAKLAGKYGINIGTEAGEEGAQEMVSIANQNRVTSGQYDPTNDMWGRLTGLGIDSVVTGVDAAAGNDTEALDRILDAMKEGGKIAAMFGGTTMAVNSTVNTVIDNNTGKNILSSGNDLDILISLGRSADPKTESYQIATDLLKRQNTGKKISNTEVGWLYRALRDEKVLENSVATNRTTEDERAAVSDWGDGNTYTLEQLARENAAKNASVTPEWLTRETQQANAGAATGSSSRSTTDYTAEIKKWTGYGDSGVKAFMEALEQSDAAPEAVRAGFQAAYESGLVGLDRKSVELITPLQEQAFIAGTMDYMANQAKDKAKTFKVSDEAGFDRTGAPADVTDTQAEILDMLAKNLGSKSYFDGDQDFNAQITGDGTVRYSTSFQREIRDESGNVVKTLTVVDHALHELGAHRAMQVAPDATRAFINKFYSYLMESSPSTAATLAERKQQFYGSRGQQLTTDKAFEEVIANEIFPALYRSDEKELRRALDSIFEGKDAQQVKKGARTFRDVLHDMWQKIKDFAAKLRRKGDIAAAREAEQVADSVKELRDMFENVLKIAAEQVKAKRENGVENRAEQEYNGNNESQLSAKYWKPNLTKKEWNLLNTRMEREIGSSKRVIDEATKWLYANENGTTVFAVYGIGDGTEATPLYASGGKQAKADYNKWSNFWEGYLNEPDADRTDFDSWLESVRSEQGYQRGNLYDSAGRTADADDDRVHGQASERNGNRASGAGKENRGSVITDEDTQYSLVTDKETLDFLNGQNLVKVYRAMQEIDGKLYPPMAAITKGADGKSQLAPSTKKGAWYQSDERPDLIKFDKKGKPYFELKKGNGKMVPAAYNPYFHTSVTPLNDQFSSAYDRPNLVVVEGYIPESELTSGYKAQYAKDSVGETTWHAGPVASKLKGDKARRVFLSRWFKAERVVPVNEVARTIAQTLDGEKLSVPWNVVTPSLREALEQQGVEIDYKDAKFGSKVVSFESTQESVQYSLKDSEGTTLTKAQQDFFKDSKARDKDGNLLVFYHGTLGSGFSVFDPEFSDDRTSLFFTTSLHNAASYSGTYDLHGESTGSGAAANYAVYLNLENPLILHAEDAHYDDVKFYTPEMKAMEERSNELTNYGYSLDKDDPRRADAFAESDGLLDALDEMDLWNGDHKDTRSIAKWAKQHGYDGVIFHDLIDYAGVMDVPVEPATVAIAFKSEQVKSATNKNPTSDPDIQFSLKTPVEQTRNLIALHNLTEDKLLKSINLGGFPMPSIAVTATDIPHTNFGDITLVMSKTTIDPKFSRKNTVYSADAWTPTFPQIEYEADPTVEKKISKMYYDLAKTHGYDFVKPMYGYAQYLGDELNRQGGVDGIIERLIDNPGMMQVYLAATGKEPIADIKKETVTRLDQNKIDRYDYFIDKLGEDVINELVTRGDEKPIDARKRWVEAHGEGLVAAYRGYLADSGLDADIIENVMEHTKTGDMLREITGARNYLKTGVETVSVETDTAATNEAIRKAAGDGYETWLRDLFEGAVKDTGIYNNKELYTASGNRRSFKQTHYPVTLENIAKAMAEQNGGNTRNVSGFYGIKSLRAGTAKRFSSIKEMHEYEGRLKHLTQEEADAITDALHDRMHDLITKILETKGRGSNSNDFMAYDSIGNMLMEMAELETKTIDSLSKKSKEWHYQLNNGILAEIRDLLFDVAQMPVNIFEAKPERVVRFDEVLAAVLPDDASRQLRDALEAQGVSVLTYEKGNDAARLEVVNGVDGAQFSLKEHNDLLKENAKLKEVNEALREQFKRTEFAQVDKKSLDKFTKALLKDYQSGADINEIRDALNDVYTYMANGEDGQHPVWNDLQQRAYDVAVSILQEANIINDDMYQAYKGLRDRLRTSPISINKMYDNDISGYESIEEFRRANFGRIKITNDGTPVDMVYAELANTYPEFFDESAYSTQADQLSHIAEVLDSLQPYEVNPYSTNMRQAATWLASDIIERFYELPQAKPTFADKQATKLTKQVIKDAKKLENLREKKNERIKELIRKNREKVKATTQKEREKRVAAVKEVKEHYKDKERKASESRKARTLRAKIMRHAQEMSKKLLRPTDKQHIPQELRGTVVELLESINMESRYTIDPDTGKRLSNGEGDPTKRTEKFTELQKMLKEIKARGGDGMVFDPSLVGAPEDGIPSKFDDVIAMKDTPLHAMNTEQLTTIWEVLKAVETAISTAGKTLSKNKYGYTVDWATAFEEDTATKKVKRSLTERHYTLDIETPYTFFSHYGDAGINLYRMLRNAQDHQQLMQGELAAKIRDLVSLELHDKLEKETTTFTTDRGEKLVLSKAHVMEMYLLSKRQQAYNHLIHGGVVQPEVGKIRRGTSVTLLTETDVAKITSSLTAEERTLADKYRDLTNLLAKWGNEASMKAYGYEKFSDPDYWPIKSASEHVQHTVEKNATNRARSIANMGSAKPLTPNATNTLDLPGIFSTFDNHASDMLDYAAWLLPMEDVNRLFNFKFKNEDGATVKTMQDLLNDYGGARSSQYWDNLMTDIQNGVNLPDDTAFEGLVSKVIGNTKRASVAANLRVVIQQPTAFVRAAFVLDPDLMLLNAGKGVTVKSMMDGWEKAKKYAPIAARKADGGFEIASNPKRLSEIFYKPETKWGKTKAGAKDAGMFLPGVMDAATWGVLWNTAESQIKRDNKDLTPGTEAFYKAVAELFTDVIDQTQVVDGVLQRSQAMRSSSSIMKQMTSFTGEPTQAGNMVIRAYDKLRYETDSKKRTAAIKGLSRAVAAYMVTAAINAFAQSLVDALRDDDDEKDFWEKVWKAFSGISGKEETWWDFARNILLASNAANNLNPLTWIPVAKDVLSLVQGYSVQRMDVSAIEDLIDSIVMTIKTIGGDGKQTTGYAALRSILFGWKLAGGGGYNFLRDLEGVVRTFQVGTGDYIALYETEKLMTKPKNNVTAYTDMLYLAYTEDKEQFDELYARMLEDDELKSEDKTTAEVIAGKLQGKLVKDLYELYKTDSKAYEEMYNDLVKRDFLKTGVKSSDPEKDTFISTEEHIRSAMESLMKKEQGVKSVDDLESRYLGPDQQRRYNSTMRSIQSSGIWQNANGEQRDNLEDNLRSIVLESDEKMLETLKEGAPYGLDEGEYLLYKLAMEMVDQPNENGNLGTYTSSERAEAILSLGVGDGEMAFLWGTDQALEAYGYGIDMEKYITFKAEIGNIVSDKDRRGNTISGSRKRKVIAYLNSLGVSRKEYYYLLGTVYDLEDDPNYRRYFGR